MGKDTVKLYRQSDRIVTQNYGKGREGRTLRRPTGLMNME
jgi:hypothetical protein